MNKKILFFLLVIFLSGCVTTPQRPQQLAVYNLNGTNYISLAAVCDLKGINLDYDLFSKSISLRKDAQEIDLLLGSAAILVNGTLKNLSSVVDTYRGIVVVPAKFKEHIIDPLFPDANANKPLPNLVFSSKIKRIVIDPGHGGKDPGAIGKSGLREKDVVLDIAKRLARQLEAQGKTVYMTRDSDVFIPLPKRAEFANRKNADLFVSIHANANRARSVCGLEVYYLSPSVNDLTCAITAAEDTAPRIEGANFGIQSQQLKATVWDLIYTDNRAESVELASKICRTVSSDMGLNVLGVKSAGFYVLKWTRMPAVLVETGFISNANEERLFKNSLYRQQMAEAIAEGISDYCRDFAIAEGPKR